MFADDINFFYSHSNVKELFRTMNAELSHLNDWFCANKLSLNTDKTKYALLHKGESKNKILKSIGILFKASRSLNSKSLPNIYFALVHPYIN